MSRAPSVSGRERRRSSSAERTLPSRKLSSALEDHSHTAVTRAIYHHAREFLKKARADAPSQHRGRRAMLAVCQAARAVILESAVVQVIVRCVERTKQLRAKQADDRWHTLGDTRLLFGGQMGIESAKKISEALGEMLADFEGDDDVRNRFLNVAKSFNQSEVSLRQLQQSFGHNLDGLEAMRNNFDRCTEEVIRLVSLLEGDCASMRVQLHRTLKSPRERMSEKLFGGIENLGKSKLLLENIPQSPEDHISGLLTKLEHDLCDSPLTAMVQVAQDVNDHIVKQLSEKGRLEKLRPCRLSFDASARGQNFVSPSIVIEEMFHSLKPCIFESANAMAELDTDPDVSLERSTTAELIESGGLMSPTRPPVDLSFARAQLGRVPRSKASKESNPGGKRKGSKVSVTRARGSSVSSVPESAELNNDFKTPELLVTGDRHNPHPFESSGSLSMPVKPSRVPKSSDLAGPARSSSPDLPGTVQKETGSNAGLSAVQSVPSASAKAFGGIGGDELRQFSAESQLNSLGAQNPPSEVPLCPTSVSGTTGVNSYKACESHGTHMEERNEDTKIHAYGGEHCERPVGKLTPLESGAVPQMASLDVGSPFALPSVHEHEHQILQDLKYNSHLSLHPPSHSADQYPATGFGGSSHSSPSGHAGHAGHAHAGHGHIGQHGKLPVLSNEDHPHEGHALQALQALQSPQEVQNLTGPVIGGAQIESRRRSRHRKASEPELSADFSRFMAPSERAGYEQPMTANPFMGSPLLVTKSKLEERPRRQSLTATTSEPFLHQPLERARLMGLPPMGLSGLSGFALCGNAPAPLPPGPRQGRATSSPMVGTLRTRPASLDGRCRLGRATSGLLPTLMPLEGQAMVSHVPLHRKASPARSIGAEDGPQSDHEMLR